MKQKLFRRQHYLFLAYFLNQQYQGYKRYKSKEKIVKEIIENFIEWLEDTQENFNSARFREAVFYKE